MASIRHPNVANFLGICLMPPCLITGACAADHDRIAGPEQQGMARQPVVVRGAAEHVVLFSRQCNTLPWCCLLAAEYCERGSLFDVLRQARQGALELPWRRRLSLVRPASAAVAAAAF